MPQCEICGTELDPYSEEVLCDACLEEQEESDADEDEDFDDEY